MSILADWFRRAMGKDRATLIGRDNAVCREWQHAYPDVALGESIMQAKFDAANERIAAATAVNQGQRQEAYAQACHARTKGWPQWKINFDLTAHERSIRTARGNRTRYARLRAEKVK